MKKREKYVRNEPEQLELPFEGLEHDTDKGVAAMAAAFVGGVLVVCAVVWVIWSMLRSGM